MNYKIDNKLIYVLTGGLLFNFLFWSEELALNLVMYSAFILTIYQLNYELFKDKKLIIITLLHVFACAMLLFNHAILTIIIWYISLFILVGYLHNIQLRSIFMALGAAFLQFISAPFNLYKKISDVKIAGLPVKPLLKLAKYVIIPSFILLLFVNIYSAANPVFDIYISTFLEDLSTIINTIFSFFFKEISIERIAFLVVGILFSSGLFIACKNKLVKMELNYDENLLRTKIDKKKQSNWREIAILFSGNLINRKMALKTENTIAIISFSGLNALLLFLNGIDISSLWMGNLGSLNFSQALHGSINALIFSIIMAMIVILYFFKGNLNFYSKNKMIRFLAYGWIIQNTFLIFSVLLRDYHYIAMHGLTYKRIGVIVFSLLCFIGLLTVYIKVAKKKSLFYLFKTNGAIWYALLLLSGGINWDVFITNYNIERRNSVTLDVSYLMKLSDKTLPQLIKNKEILKKYLSPSTSPYAIAPVTLKAIPNSLELNKQIKQSLAQNLEKKLALRVEKFNENQQNISWLSWNYRDWQTKQYLNQFKGN